jgi:AcrR family transcriptional regulator
MTVSLRERKKAETRTALASAALRLAIELGPDRVTVDEIAEASGVSPRTFFNYFASKEDAILGNSSASTSRLVEHLAERPPDEPPLDALRAAMHAGIDHLQSDPDEWIARNRLVRGYPSLAVRYAARLADLEREVVLEVARRTGLDADRDPYPGVVAGAAMSGARVALTLWQQRGPRGSLPALLDEVFDQLMTGLAQPARRRK